MEDASDADPKKVSEVFDNAFELFRSIEKSEESISSPAMKAKVKDAIKAFEDVTRAVSLLGMFSSNEAVEEIATEDLKFLLLPAFLGSLTLRIESNRGHVLDAAEVYFMDYLKRCKEYDITNIKIPGRREENDESGKEVATPSGIPASLIAMVSSRNEKLRRYREQKDFEKHMEHLIKVTKSDWSSNEEQRRDYILTLVRYWVNQSLEELISIDMEKPLVKHMEEMKLSGKKFRQQEDRKPPPPLKTVIITRDQVQKAVYGAGYPSLPVMTVDEFYDQRVQSGEFPDPCCRPKASQDIANGKEKVPEGEEDEDALTEEQENEELRRARDFDEYKDMHRRGCGNRYNRS